MKKNEHEGHYAKKSPFKKLLRMAKLTLFLLLAGLLQVSANSYSQSTKINLGLKDATLVEIFDQIEEQSEFRFFYDNDQLETNETFTVNFNNEKIEKILNTLFEGKNVSYEVLDRHILITTSDDASNDGEQQDGVNGNVTDDNGEPLPGVTVIIKGTTHGTVTDINGNFQLTDVTPNNVLQFSFVGMMSQEIAVGNKKTFTIEMKADAIGIEEVVAVGYGSQKKINLTGALGNLNSEAIESKPVTKISQALAGEISGVTVESNSGAPGRSAANIRIRGLGTFSGAGTNPLVLVDGIPSSLDNINPNDIQNISVLKDAASAAIYGSRAANGVILVETKRGKSGQLVVNYNGYVGKQVATESAEFVNSWEYAELMNEYWINSGAGAIYSDEDIAKFKSGEDPDNYPNSQHYDDLFDSGSGMQTAHNLSFTGGTEKNNYHFSTGYLKQDGLIDENTYNRYNFLLNLDSKLSEKFNLQISLGGDVSKINEPAQAGSGDLSGIITGAVRLPVTIAGRKSDGTYGWLTNQYPEASMDSESFRENKLKHFLGNAKLTWNIFRGLSLSGKVGYNVNVSDNVLYNAKMTLDPNRTVSPAKLDRSNNQNTELILEALLTYQKSVNDHNFKALVGYNQDEFYSESLSGYRDNFPNNSLYLLNAGSADNMQNSGTAYEWALQSVFGRINYDYKSKYLLELNARYDGSSRFPEDNRFGFFPSVSAGWRISEESFFQDNITWMDNLKLRASYGTLGNQKIGNYPYQSTLSLGQDYVFGMNKALVSGANVLNLPNSEITWETTKMTDIGLDFTLFNNKVSVVVDYFSKTTEDILYKISTSTTLGMTPSEVNAGEVKNTGWDFNIVHTNDLGDFSYNITTNFAVVKNEVTKLADIERDIAKGLFVGESLMSIYGYMSDGLFVDQNDVDTYATQPYKAEPGFVKRKDISGPDGVPDGKADPTYDRVILGSRFPKYTYGGSFSANYKGFDFLAQFSGSGGMKRKMSNLQTYIAFQNETTPQRWMVEDRWTVENPNPNAKYPKFGNGLMTGGIGGDTSYTIKDASYLRLKNLQLGYTLPANTVEKLGLSKLRLYVSGSNLITFDNFYDGWDPEPTNPGAHSFYPFTSVFLFGVNASF